VKINSGFAVHHILKLYAVLFVELIFQNAVFPLFSKFQAEYHKSVYNLSNASTCG
jgi:hypothetical protein